MRVAMYYHNQDVRIEEMPVPEIRPGELLVRLEASGICGSDVMEWYRRPKAPLVLGHEIAGEIAAVGEGAFLRFEVENSRFEPRTSNLEPRIHSQPMRRTISVCRSPSDIPSLKSGST